MLEDKIVELKALQHRADELSYILIEVEGEEYFKYFAELEHVEFAIEELQLEIDEIHELFRSQGSL